MASQVDVQHRDAKVFQSPRCVHADLTHVQRPLTALFVSEQVQLSTQHPVLVPAWAVWLVQDQLAWGPWQGTAGTRASVNNTQWSPSSLTSVPASAHSCHSSASWVVWSSEMILRVPEVEVSLTHCLWESQPPLE